MVTVVPIWKVREALHARGYRDLDVFLIDHGYPAAYRAQGDSVFFFDGAEGAALLLTDDQPAGPRFGAAADTPPLQPAPGAQLATLEPRRVFFGGVAAGVSAALVAGVLIAIARRA